MNPYFHYPTQLLHLLSVPSIANFQADEKAMTRFIIGTIAQLDNPLTPSAKGNTALKYYLEKTTLAQLQSERDDILTTSSEDIRAMKKMVADGLDSDTYCVYGNEEKVTTEKGLFNKLVKISK